MLRSLLISCAAAALLPAVFAGVSAAADAGCLTPQERREVSASGKVVPLSRAIRAAHARRTDVVDARLCHGPKGLVYLLTLLAQNGKVTRATVDAASGTLTGG
jgi:uncharacterized membrane protein YkoI